MIGLVVSVVVVGVMILSLLGLLAFEVARSFMAFVSEKHHRRGSHRRREHKHRDDRHKDVHVQQWSPVVRVGHDLDACEGDAKASDRSDRSDYAQGTVHFDATQVDDEGKHKHGKHLREEPGDLWCNCHGPSVSAVHS